MLAEVILGQILNKQAARWCSMKLDELDCP
jgi:hypothetical protein